MRAAQAAQVMPSRSSSTAAMDLLHEQQRQRRQMQHLGGGGAEQRARRRAQAPAADADQGIKLAQRELAKPDNMTIEMGALAALRSVHRPETETMLEAFYQRHRNDHLIIDKWFGLNASIPGADAAQRIERLLKHPDFKLTTPNRVYALIANFANGNSTGNGG